MTREEFLSRVDSPEKFYRFCVRFNLDNYYSEIYDSDRINGYILDCIEDYDNWEDVARFLEDIPKNAEYYKVDDWGDVTEYDLDDVYDDAGTLYTQLENDGVFDDPAIYRYFGIPYPEDEFEVEDDLEDTDIEEESDVNEEVLMALLSAG